MDYLVGNLSIRDIVDLDSINLCLGFQFNEQPLD